MAIIYTYPVKSTPANDDLILISDSADSKKTKQIKVSSLPSSGSGITLTTTGTSGVATLTGTVLNIPNYTTTGGTPATPLNSVQFNNAGAFGGSSKLTYIDSTRTLSIGDQDVFGAVVNIAGGSGVAGQLRLGDSGASGNEVTLKAAADISTDYTITLPGDGPDASNKILQSDASGNLSWINTPASTAPQGDDGQFQYKNGSSFAGTDTLRFDADKIHIGKGGGTPTRGQLVMYGDGTNASDIQLYNSGNNRFLKIAQQAGATADLTLTFPGVAPGGNTKMLQSDSSGQLSWIDTPSGGSGISFSGTTANGIATYSNSTTANVSSAFTVSGNKLSAPAGSLADPSIEVGAIGGLYAASGGIILAHSGANAISVSSSLIVNYKLTQFQAGVKFGATGETLDSYEEGTWTPSPYVPTGTPPTASVAVGSFTKIGDLVNCYFYLNITSTSSAIVPMIISGLPFSASNTNGYRGMVSISRNDGTNFIQQQPTSGLVTGSQVVLKRPDITATHGGGATSITNTETIDASWYASASLNYILEGTIIFKV